MEMKISSAENISDQPFRYKLKISCSDALEMIDELIHEKSILICEYENKIRQLEDERDHYKSILLDCV